MDEKAKDVLLCDIVNTYNVCGKIFNEMRYNVMGGGRMKFARIEKLVASFRND